MKTCPQRLLTVMSLVRIRPGEPRSAHTADQLTESSAITSSASRRGPRVDASAAQSGLTMTMASNAEGKSRGSQNESQAIDALVERTTCVTTSATRARRHSAPFTGARRLRIEYASPLTERRANVCSRGRLE